VKLIISTLFTIYLKEKTHIKHFFIYSYINSGVKELIKQMEVIWQVICKVTFASKYPNIAKNKQENNCVPELAAYL